MPRMRKVGGEWLTTNKKYRKVNGVWRRVSASYVKVDGVWKPIFQPMYVTPFITNADKLTGTAGVIWDDEAGAYRAFIDGTVAAGYVVEVGFKITNFPAFSDISVKTSTYDGIPHIVPIGFYANGEARGTKQGTSTVSYNDFRDVLNNFVLSIRLTSTTTQVQKFALYDVKINNQSVPLI